MNETIRHLSDDLDAALDQGVDDILGDLCGQIAALRQTLDAIERQVLEGAAGAKAALQGHVSLCRRFNDEIVIMKDVVSVITATPQP